MKPQCPAKCGRELPVSCVLCATCWCLVPHAMKAEIKNAAHALSKTRASNLIQPAMRRLRDAKTAAIQYVIDMKKETA